jgi:hypothetical protein
MENSQLEQQIASLEQELQSKRQELQGSDVEQMPTDQELVHQAVGEKIQQQMPSYQAPAVPSDDGASSWKDPAIAQQVQELVNVAFTKGIDDAITEALKSGNPALVDAFHDLMRDQLVEELVKRGKLKPVS